MVIFIFVYDIWELDSRHVNKIKQFVSFLVQRICYFELFAWTWIFQLRSHKMESLTNVSYDFLHLRCTKMNLFPQGTIRMLLKTQSCGQLETLYEILPGEYRYWYWQWFHCIYEVNFTFHVDTIDVESRWLPGAFISLYFAICIPFVLVAPIVLWIVWVCSCSLYS